MNGPLTRYTTPHQVRPASGLYSPRLTSIYPTFNVSLFLKKGRLKGTVSRDFRLQVFFMNQFPPSPWVRVSHLGSFNFFFYIREDIHSSTCIGGNLPSVSLIPVVHVELRISPPIFEKKSKWLLCMLFLGAWGKMIHEKKSSEKSCNIVPLKPFNHCEIYYTYTH